MNRATSRTQIRQGGAAAALTGLAVLALAWPAAAMPLCVSDGDALYAGTSACRAAGPRGGSIVITPPDEGSVCATRRGGRVFVRARGCRAAEVAVRPSALRGEATVLCAGRRGGRVHWRFLACRRSEVSLDAAAVLAAQDDQTPTCVDLAGELRMTLASLTARAQMLRRTVLAGELIGWDDVAYVVAMEAPALEADAARIRVLVTRLGIDDAMAVTDRMELALADVRNDPAGALGLVLANAAMLVTLVP
jgi:hypothetical protein